MEERIVHEVLLDPEFYLTASRYEEMHQLLIQHADKAAEAFHSAIDHYGQSLSASLILLLVI